MTVSEETKTRSSKSLLEKYNIPLAHFEFEYINNCNNLKEIERIVKVLRSNEEGFYPDLLKCAESKLKEISPNNSLLRVEIPVLSKSSFSSKDWKTIVEDLQDWKDEVSLVEKKLSKTSKKTSTISYPSIRKNEKIGDSKVEDMNIEGPMEKIKSFEYDKWDKYDAEEECKKIDLEEERRKEIKEKENREAILRRKKEVMMEEEQRVIEEIKASIISMTDTERNVYAMKEKDLGNEYYKANEINKALKHYTRSIVIKPTAVAYNNRAAAYLKQCKYSKVLEDTNIVLQMDPDNVKAYYRRALSLQHKNEFHKALDDIREVLKREPNHIIARHIADQLRDHCQELPRKCKLRVKDETGKNHTKVIEVTEEEMLRDYKDKDFVEVNDWGLPKIMCNCNGKYTNDPGIRNNDRVRFQHLHLKNKKKIEETISGSIQNQTMFAPGERHSGKSKRMEILELEKIIEDSPPKVTETVNNKGLGGDGRLNELANLERLADDLTSSSCISGKKVGVSGKEVKEGSNWSTRGGESTSIVFNEGGGFGRAITPSDIIMEENQMENKSFKNKQNQEEKDIWEKISDVDEDEDDDKGSDGKVGCSSPSFLLRQAGDKRPKEEDEEVEDMGISELGRRRSKMKGNVGEEAGVGTLVGDEDEKVIEEGRGDDSGDSKISVKKRRPKGGSGVGNRSREGNETTNGMMVDTVLINSGISSLNFSQNHQTSPTTSPIIEVAMKYREKVSRHPKQQGSTQMLVEQTTTDPGVGQGAESVGTFVNATSSYLSKDPSTTSYLITPFNFCKSWSQITRNLGRGDLAIGEKSRLLRMVRPHLLRAYVGNKMEDTMLSDFIECLYKNFSVQSERELIIEYLTAIMQLERFSIVYSFLTVNEKNFAHKLLEVLGPDVNQLLQSGYK